MKKKKNSWLSIEHASAGQPVNIAIGKTQASGLSIISSSPLRDGILSQGHDYVSEDHGRP